MVTTKDIRFIVINKQEDLPTELEMKGRLHGATQLEEFIMPNGDIIRLMMNWEIRFPLFWILGGELFIDGGYLTDSFRNQSIDQIEWNGGFGITLMTPLVPLRLDFAIPLIKSTGGFNSWKIQLGASYIF